MRELEAHFLVRDELLLNEEGGRRDEPIEGLRRSDAWFVRKTVEKS